MTYKEYTEKIKRINEVTDYDRATNPFGMFRMMSMKEFKIFVLHYDWYMDDNKRKKVFVLYYSDIKLRQKNELLINTG